MTTMTDKEEDLPVVDYSTKVTKSGKYAEFFVRGWLSKPFDHPYIVEYAANFTLPHDFGHPGAILITNLLDKEIHLVQIVVHGFSEGSLFFNVNTWIHSQKDIPESRIIFQAGTFYRSPAPGAPPFVKVGDKVQKGQIICVIEAMKLMNGIEVRSYCTDVSLDASVDAMEVAGEEQPTKQSEVDYAEAVSF
ncbi:Biotin carboxyl carrier protein of acetyl-CoA carboxylase 2, chloroplastic [Capsicum baccatum]|uniref:Biotin carboxyl carrier protein of acetyl-CoA carboxylase n=1 Tax=Capsicum baccatum TaxID=33114 RepID=A0A2G2VT26_CAPBA|nr:Biotin carboxyl carrier protein of acetyl-CoA carboxylase 2, chloroplastic [Capsicum baccatum]